MSDVYQEEFSEDDVAAPTPRKLKKKDEGVRRSVAKLKTQLKRQGIMGVPGQRGRSVRVAAADRAWPVE